MERVRNNELMNDLLDVITHGSLTELNRFLVAHDGRIFHLDVGTGIYAFLINSISYSKFNIMDLESKLALLVQFGYDVNEPDGRLKSPPIVLASYNCPLYFFKALLEVGADPNTPDSDGCTALWNAVFNFRGEPKSVDKIKLLIKHGASFDIANQAGNSPKSWIIKAKDYVERGLFGPENDVTRYIPEINEYLR